MPVSKVGLLEKPRLLPLALKQLETKVRKKQFKMPLNKDFL